MVKTLDDQDRARPRRRRNARGQGERLADEIVEGALAIIDRTGSEEAVTLRSVAREVGIAAPSIYAHFADRDAVLWAVVAKAFEQLRQILAAAGEGIEDPVERLLAGTRAYVAFGADHPARYRTLFARQFPPGEPPTEEAPSGGPVPYWVLDPRYPPVGASAFALLVDSIQRCVAAGRSTSTDPFADATDVWLALHGVVSLGATMCDFPWPPTDQLVERVVRTLAKVQP